MTGFFQSAVHGMLKALGVGPGLSERRLDNFLFLTTFLFKSQPSKLFFQTNICPKFSLLAAFNMMAA